MTTTNTTTAAAILALDTRTEGDRFVARATGRSFAFVAAALGGGMENISSAEWASGAVNAFVREHGMADVPHVFMATHSAGVREWEPVRGRELAFYPDNFFRGGWYVLREEDVTRLHLESAVSRSALTAERQADGTWTVTLEVPIQNGVRYEGAYWRCFHNTLQV